MDEVRNEASEVSGTVVQAGGDVTVYVDGDQGAGSLVVTVDRSAIEELVEFADEPGLFHAWSRRVGVVVEARGARAVVLTGLRAVVLARRAPRPVGRRAVVAGAVEPARSTVDLDRDPPRSPGEGFPVAVSATRPHVLALDLVVREHEVDWRLELDWVSDGESGVFRVPDAGHFTHRPPGATAGLAGEVPVLVPGRPEPVPVGPGAVSPERIRRLLDQVIEHWSQTWQWLTSTRHFAMAGHVAAIDPGRVREWMRASPRMGHKELLGVARAVAPADPELTRLLVARVRHARTAAGRSEPEVELLAELAATIRVVDPASARDLLDEAEPLVPKMYGGPGMGMAILAAAWGPLDPRRARALALEAAGLWTEGRPPLSARPRREVDHLVRALVWSDPEQAVRLAREHDLLALLAGQPGIDGRRLVTESTDPQRTALLLEEVAEPADTDWWVAQARAVAPLLVVEQRVRLLSRVAAVVAPGPARELITEAERELDSVISAADHPRASAEVACAIALHDPDRAERLAQAIRSPKQRTTVLVAVAHALHRRLDPRGSAERSPRRPPAPAP
ncbi:hypothetical protein AB0H12_27695 [Actinosynnema sp. NPDC023794]